MSFLCIHVIISRINQKGLKKMGEYGSSIIHFNESMDTKSHLYGDESPTNAETLMNKGNSLEDMNKLDEAIHAHNQCLKILTKDEDTNEYHKYSR